MDLNYFIDLAYKKSLFKNENNPIQLKEIECIYQNIDNVLNKILDINYEFSIPKKIIIPKPNGKERYVYFFNLEERTVLSIIYQYLNKTFSHRVHPKVFSYRKGICTIDAVNSIISENQYSNRYGLKADISKYFDSVSEDIIHKEIENLFPIDTSLISPITDYRNLSDEEFMGIIKLLLLKVYSINKYVDNKGVVHEQFLSLIQGNPIASFFANVLLFNLDTRLDDNFKIYARYSDDILVFTKSENESKIAFNIMEEELSKIGLHINPKKIEHFNPQDEISFLGLKLLPNKKVSMSDEMLKKQKKKVSSLCKSLRREISKGKITPKQAVKRMFKNLNNLLYKPFIINPTKFGWAYYIFRYINIIDDLRELDLYIKDQAKYLYYGKHNKNMRYCLTTEELKDLGYKSLVEYYLIFKYDFDYYYYTVYNM